MRHSDLSEGQGSIWVRKGGAGEHDFILEGSYHPHSIPFKTSCTTKENGNTDYENKSFKRMKNLKKKI